MTSVNLDFVAVGPQRTGTSWLHAVLRQHPEIQLPVRVKETFFFDKHFDRGVAWYLGQFGTQSGALVGEIGPTYFDDPAALRRIRATAPRARIIATLRDPIERALSLLRHHHRKGRVQGDDIRRAAQAQPKILSAGHYARHVPAWQDAFGTDHVLVLLAEELEESPQSSLDTITDFLGVQPLTVPPVSDEQIGSARRAPRYPTLAKWSWRAAHELRKAGLHEVVEWGKRVGARRIAMSSSNTAQVVSLSVQDRVWMRELYREDIEYVAKLVDRAPNWPSCRVKQETGPS